MLLPPTVFMAFLVTVTNIGVCGTLWVCLLLQSLAAGDEVAAIVQALYEQPNHNKLYPEQIVVLTGKLRWH